MSSTSATINATTGTTTPTVTATTTTRLAITKPTEHTSIGGISVGSKNAGKKRIWITWIMIVDVLSLIILAKNRIIF